MPKSPAIPTSVRTAIKKRDLERCLRCGGRGTELHHRMRRREGGHGLWNIVTLCGSCHRWAHANVAAAREDGFIIPTYTESPEWEPVRAWWSWLRLDEHGGITHQEGRQPSGSEE